MPKELLPEGLLIVLYPVLQRLMHGHLSSVKNVASSSWCLSTDSCVLKCDRCSPSQNHD
jgi:hypothetical protein